VVDVLPKSITHRILEPALQMSEPVRMICREADLDTLLAELAVHRLDLVLSDRPIPPQSVHGVSVTSLASARSVSLLQRNWKRS
jgi:LysR family transcriptional activator of nhaA